MRPCTPGSATTCTSKSGGEAAFAAGRLMFTPSPERSRRITRRIGCLLYGAPACLASRPSVHGVVAVPERHLVFATATGEKTLAFIDDRTGKVRSRVRRRVPERHRLRSGLGQRLRLQQPRSRSR